jgi:hypothetical protein
MQMVTGTKWFIFLKQEYSKAQSLLGIHYICTLRYLFVQCTTALTLCITASWSRGGTVSRVSGQAAMSLLLHCPEPTAALHPFLGGRVPCSQGGVPFPRIHAHSLPIVQNKHSCTVMTLKLFSCWKEFTKWDRDVHENQHCRILREKKYLLGL